MSFIQQIREPQKLLSRGSDMLRILFSEAPSGRVIKTEEKLKLGQKYIAVIK